MAQAITGVRIRYAEDSNQNNTYSDALSFSVDASNFVYNNKTLPQILDSLTAKDNQLANNISGKLNHTSGVLRDGYLQVGIGSNTDANQLPRAGIGVGGNSTSGARNLILYSKDENSGSDYKSDIQLIRPDGLVNIAAKYDGRLQWGLGSNTDGKNAPYGAIGVRFETRTKEQRSVTTNRAVSFISSKENQQMIKEDGTINVSEKYNGQIFSPKIYWGLKNNDDATGYPRIELMKAGNVSSNNVRLWLASKTAANNAIVDQTDIINSDGKILSNFVRKTNSDHSTQIIENAVIKSGVGSNADLSNSDGYPFVRLGLVTGGSHTGNYDIQAFYGSGKANSEILVRGTDNVVLPDFAKFGRTYTPNSIEYASPSNGSTTNGLTVQFIRTLGTVVVNIYGTLTQALSSKSAYVNICSAVPADFKWSTKYSSASGKVLSRTWNILLNGTYYGQIRLIDNTIKIGHTKRIDTGEQEDIAANQQIYASFTYACDIV